MAQHGGIPSSHIAKLYDGADCCCETDEAACLQHCCGHTNEGVATVFGTWSPRGWVLPLWIDFSTVLSREVSIKDTWEALAGENAAYPSFGPRANKMHEFYSHGGQARTIGAHRAHYYE